MCASIPPREASEWCFSFFFFCVWLFQTHIRPHLCTIDECEDTALNVVQIISSTRWMTGGDGAHGFHEWMETGVSRSLFPRLIEKLIASAKRRWPDENVIYFLFLVSQWLSCRFIPYPTKTTSNMMASTAFLYSPWRWLVGSAGSIFFPVFHVALFSGVFSFSHWSHMKKFSIENPMLLILICSFSLQ